MLLLDCFAGYSLLDISSRLCWMNLLDCCARDFLLNLRLALLDALLDSCAGKSLLELKQAMLDALLDCCAGDFLLEL